MILVTGFGPFAGVSDNPSARAARAVDGCRVRGHTVVGEVLPVSYRRAPDRVCALVERLQPIALLCLGVASQRLGCEVERLAHCRVDPDQPDVDGCLGHLGSGPARRPSTLDVERLAAALQAEVSEDAGNYVCNALLYTLLKRLERPPLAFVHLPSSGIAPERLLRGLAALPGGVGEGKAVQMG